ncbi:uncharacterized protein [Hetaerina americana]|uniref:uncharacterized protein isoform X2 n=1 Tax=Hetaerina americana TaxID=62018 RepID=UPI003A7F3DD9
MASVASTAEVCRCCLQEKGGLISIFEVVSEKIPFNYAAVVKKCVGVEITPGDGFSSQICTGCSEEAERSYKFKEMCITSDRKLRPAAEAELVFDVGCQTDDCHPWREKEDGNLKGDQGVHKALENPSDIPLSEESILSVLGLEKSKVPEGLEGNELVSLSSPVSDGDFSNWLADNQEEIKESTALAGQASTTCEESKGSSNEHFSGSPAFESKLPAQNTLGSRDAVDKSGTTQNEIEEKGVHIVQSKLDGVDVNKTSKQNENGGDEMGKFKSPLALGGDKSGSSVEGRVTVKSLEDLTYDIKSVPSNTVMSKSSIIPSPVESELSGKVYETSINNQNKELVVSKCRAISNTPSSSNSKLLPSNTDGNDGQSTNHSRDECHRENKGERQYENCNENNLQNSLNKRIEGENLEKSINTKENPAREWPSTNISEEHLENSSNNVNKDANYSENISDINRKRMRENNAKGSLEKDSQEGSTGPSAKRTCKVGVLPNDDDPLKERVPSKEGDSEISSSETTASIADPGRGKENMGGETRELGEIKKCSGVEGRNELDAPEAFSDDDMNADNDSVPESSGSEYVPVDSPALSDDSARPLRPRTKPKTREKPPDSKVEVKSFNIRECRVVLSDIARPGSSALTNSNSMSSHVSVSSLKSIENEEENVRNKEEAEKETEEISDNTSSCTAWIKVEPEDMEEMEDEQGEENILDEGEVNEGAKEQEMASSSEVNAELAQGAKHTIPSYGYPQPPGVPAAAAPVVKSPYKTAASVPALPSKGVQRFPCRLCPRVFSSMNGLKGHKRVHNSHACKICGMSFPNPLYLTSHMVCHTIVRPNSGRVNSIEVPSTSNNAEDSSRKGVSNLKMQEENINVMEPTVLIHESPNAFGDSSYQYNQTGLMMQNVCPVCSQIFPTQEKLLRHQVLANHNRTWNCEECPSLFSSSGQLQSHILSHHPTKSNFYKKEHKCNVCGKIFSKSSRLNQHMNYHLLASDPITCPMCGKYFSNIEQLNIHKKTHESVSLRGTGMNVSNDLCCSVCHRVFSKRSRLKRHMMLHESQSFPCSKCLKTFISEELLSEHQLHHNQSATQSPGNQPLVITQSPAESEESSAGITCTACGRTFTNRARLKQHVVVHTKSGFVACQNCFKVFANGQMLDMHAAVCANTEEASNGSHSNISNKSASLPHPSGFASCTSCGKAFPSKELLTEHEKTCVGLTVVKKLDGTWKVMENADDRTRVPSCSSNSSSGSGKSKQKNSSPEPVSETKTYPCKVCGKSFNNYHGLNSHMRFHQENSGGYKCELCGKLFPSRNKLSMHMSSHSAVYRCGICSQAFGLVEELKKHVSQCMAAQKGGGGTTSNYFHCNACPEVFSLLEQLAGHIKCHADEYPHACSECYKVFAHLAQLNRHMASHGIDNSVRNTCKICHKTFSNRGSLEKHTVVHTGEKKFECPYCMQRFSQKSSLHRHKLTQHETKM